MTFSVVAKRTFGSRPASYQSVRTIIILSETRPAALRAVGILLRESKPNETQGQLNFSDRISFLSSKLDAARAHQAESPRHSYSDPKSLTLAIGDDDQILQMVVRESHNILSAHGDEE